MIPALRGNTSLPVRYLLWDHDGVLVDTERWYFEASRQILEKIGLSLSDEVYLALMADGRSCWELARVAGFAESAITALRAERDALYQEFLQSKPIEIPDVQQVLAQLAGQFRMAIVTTSRREDFDLIHAGRNLLRHFEFVLTLEDYARCKPFPDPYLAGIHRFGAEPSEVIAIEDSSRGLRSARAAGIECIVIRNSFTSSMDFSGALQILDSVTELPKTVAQPPPRQV
jgi:HAD superfamily hydrolase (TIGR01509 family)